MSARECLGKNKQEKVNLPLNVSRLRPVIASSVALALSASTASAECMATDNPVLCSGSNSSVAQKIETITGGILSWAQGGDAKYTKPQFMANGRENINIKDLVIMFGSESNSPKGELQDTKLTLTTKDDNYFSILGATKGIELGDTTQRGTLTVDFSSNNSKDFILDLSKTETSNYSLMGNIEVKENTGGVGNQFTAKLKEGIKGNITIATDKATSTFILGENNNATTKIDGNITVSSGAGTFDFKSDGEVTGNITGNGTINFKLADEKSLTLKGESNTISKLDVDNASGKLILDATTSNSSGSIRDNTTTISEIANGNWLQFGFNGVGAKTLKLTGENGSTNGAFTLFSVDFENESKNNLIDITGISGSSKSLTVTGTIAPTKNQDLTIRLKDQTLTLKGGISGEGIKNLEVVSVASGGAILGKGGVSSFDTLSFIKEGDGATTAQLSIQNEKSNFANLKVASEITKTTLVLDASSSAVVTSAGNIIGEKLDIKLKSGESNNIATLNITGGKDNIIKSVTLDGNNQGIVSIRDSKTTIVDMINLSSDKKLKLSIQDGGHLFLNNGVTKSGNGGLDVILGGKGGNAILNVIGGANNQIKSISLDSDSQGIVNIQDSTTSIAERVTLREKQQLDIRIGNNSKETGILNLNKGIYSASSIVNLVFLGGTQADYSDPMSEGSKYATLSIGVDEDNSRVSSISAVGINNNLGLISRNGVASNKMFTVTGEVNVADEGELTIALIDQVLDLQGGIIGNGEKSLLIASNSYSDAKLQGIKLDFTNLFFGNTESATSKLTLLNSASFENVTANKSTSDDNQTILILDASNNAVLASIRDIEGENLEVILKSGELQSGLKSEAVSTATLLIHSEKNNTIKSLKLDSNGKSEGNRLSIQGGTTTINALELGDDKKLATTIRKSSLILGSVSGKSKLDIDFAGGDSNSSVESDKSATLGFKSSVNDTTINAISAKGANNILDATGIASNKTLTITEAVSVEGEDLTLKLKDQTLDLQKGTTGSGVIKLSISDDTSGATLKGGVNLGFSDLIFGNTDSKTSKLTLLNSASFENITANKSTGENNTTTLIVDATSNAVTASVRSIKGENLEVSLKSGDSNKAALNIMGGTNVIKTLALEGTNKATLKIAGGSTTIASMIDLSSSKKLDLEVSNGSLVLDKGISGSNAGSIDSVVLGNTNNQTAILNINAGTTKDNSALIIASLKAEGNNGIINLSGQAQGGGLPDFSKKNFQTLTINDIVKDSKSVNFLVAVGVVTQSGSTKTQSDRVIIEKTSQEGNKTHYLGVVGNASDLVGKTFTYGEEGKDNIALATVKQGTQGDSSTDVVTLEAANSISGFSLITYDVQKMTTDVNAIIGADKTGYTSYFLTGARSNGATLASQQVSASALGNNYDLYLANMNSLNKRMGELRENSNSQGLWARVFTGKQTSKFALETKSVYTTIQAGYDYAFGSEGANNYLGFALSYMNSNTNSVSVLDQSASNSVTRGIDRINTNGFEFAIYNAYVQDGASKDTGFKNGLYTDSILKFSYFSSKVKLLDQAEESTSNYALTFSQELGYRLLFGSSKSFYIDPQVEVALGYLNQSDLNQTLSTSEILKGRQDSIFTLRTRVGSNFGYDLKELTKESGFDAKIYLGTYFVYDKISGGNISLIDTYNTSVSLNPLSSTSRFVLNLGTNFKIKDAHRIYFDFEKSFGGKIITDYQVNLGYRYSFGASNYAPYNGVSTQEVEQIKTIKEIAPVSGFYLEIFDKEELSKKEMNILKKLEGDLRVQDKGNSKAYLIGPFKSKEEAQEKQPNFEGILKELKSNADIIEVE